MESATQGSISHSCPKCTLLSSRIDILNKNRDKILSTRRSQMLMMLQKVLAVIGSLYVAAVSVGLMIGDSFFVGLGVLALAFLIFVSLDALLDPEDTIKELGRYTLPGFSGHMMWYGFICCNCGGINCDYIHGHDAYITCQLCGSNIYVHSKRFYTNDGRPAPRPWRDLFRFWRMSRRMRKMRNIDSEIESIEAMGIRVLPPNTDITQIIKDLESNSGELPKKS